MISISFALGGKIHCFMALNGGGFSMADVAGGILTLDRTGISTISPNSAMADNSPVQKKKAKRDKQITLLAYKNNPAQLNQVLSSLYVGKRVFSLWCHSMDVGSPLARKRCCSNTMSVL